MLETIGAAGTASVLTLGAASAEECAESVQSETLSSATGTNGVPAPPMVNNIRYQTDRFTIAEDAFEGTDLEDRRMTVTGTWTAGPVSMGVRLMRVNFAGQPEQIGYVFTEGGELELVVVDGEEHVGPAPGAAQEDQVRNQIIVEAGQEYELDLFCQPAPVASFEFTVDVEAFHEDC